ncbi:rapid alkalinization factor [Striga asiatica]|uniref:Rapid alkalinization factor n=1 Tax=Striga asiatica TaxID=4170 RepID=A0A5A7RB59_STRAF|nr:rapid alkalinization factor [Striga asiatica]
MASRLALAVLLVVVAAMAAAAYAGDLSLAEAFVAEPDGHGLVADALNFDEEMMMESETARRQLRRGGYISYGAMGRNNVPCNRRGRSYYNCNGHQRANPYRRGCTRATRCARNNH